MIFALIFEFYIKFFLLCFSNLKDVSFYSSDHYMFRLKVPGTETVVFVHAIADTEQKLGYLGRARQLKG